MRYSTRRGIGGELGIRLLILVLASLLLFAMQQSGQFQGVRTLLSRAVSPVQWRMMVETNRLADSLTEARRGRIALLEARNLEAENQILSAELAVLREAMAENELLRQQLAYGTENPRFTFQGAHVIGRVLGYAPHDGQESLIIDAGLNRKLAVGMPVISPVGLIGRVSAVTERTARVLLISDQRSSVSALLQNSRVGGQIEGVSGGGLAMVLLTDSVPIAPGELAVTSRVGGTLPQGIPIGTVLELDFDSSTATVSAVIEPSVDFHRLESVMVVTSFEPVEAMTSGRASEENSALP